jgi:uncharacterized cofD-like protein
VPPEPPDAGARHSDRSRPAQRVPRVVAVGGGHGLSASLRAIRRYAGSVVAVVSVADDGGSSGRLRRDMPELPAPGDIRRCLSSLASAESPLGRALEHRFDTGELDGHAFGNLLLAALAEQLGSFGDAVDEVARHIGAVGRVLPATIGPVALEGLRDAGRSYADAVEGVLGQVAVQNTAGIHRLRLHPPDPESSPDVEKAILEADQVVLGPGSLFTSVLAAAIVPAVRSALQATSAQRVYVANLTPQVPETKGFTPPSRNLADRPEERGSFGWLSPVSGRFDRTHGACRGRCWAPLPPPERVQET